MTQPNNGSRTKTAIAGLDDSETSNTTPPSVINDAGGDGEAEMDEGEPLPATSGTARLCRFATKLLRKPPSILPDVDYDAVCANAREAHNTGHFETYAARTEKQASAQFDAATNGDRAQLDTVRKNLEFRENGLLIAERRTRRRIEKGPQTIDVLGDPIPWSWFHILEIPMLLVLSLFFLWLGFRCIGYLVENSGFLPPKQAWVISSGGIIAAVGLKLINETLLTLEQKRRYLKALLFGGVAAWTLWTGVFAYVTGRSLVAPAQLGDSAQDDAALLIVVQLALQLAGEIMCSAACFNAMQLICDTHQGRCGVIHPEKRRQEKLLARMVKLLARVQNTLVPLRGQLQQLECARVTHVYKSLNTFETRYRQLKIEVADLFGSQPAVSPRSDDGAKNINSNRDLLAARR